MTITLILFPNQLFQHSYIDKIFNSFDVNHNIKIKRILIWEHDYFFKKYSFHKLKLVFHRATIEGWIEENKKRFTIIHIKNEINNHIIDILKHLEKFNTTNLCFFDPIELELRKLHTEKELDQVWWIESNRLYRLEKIL